MRKLITIIALFILSSCSSVPRQQNLNYEGNIALDRGNYSVAIQKFHRALNESVSASDDQYHAIAMYGLGRAYGYLCQFKESEKWLLKSISARESLPNTKHAYLSQNIMELARLYKANKEYSKANIQFERAILILEELDIRESDPIGYAGVLEDFMFTLRAAGNNKRAKEISNIIAKLKSDNVNKPAYFVAKQYPDNCKE
ncbi:MAG: tetratricopeptide repeat protein [Gammaproteobacteria bacterium]|nr:tetratricopeptide repeat protein [Gammaproteobacteria bacterium]